MKRRLIILLLATSIICSCNRVDVEKGTPKCVVKKIKEYNKSPLYNNANVDEFVFQGSTVYVFDQGTGGADLMAQVISADCKSLGYLGGISGNTKINGEEFSNATFIKRVWEK